MISYAEKIEDYKLEHAGIYSLEDLLSIVEEYNMNLCDRYFYEHSKDKSSYDEERIEWMYIDIEATEEYIFYFIKEKEEEQSLEDYLKYLDEVEKEIRKEMYAEREENER